MILDRGRLTIAPIVLTGLLGCQPREVEAPAPVPELAKRPAEVNANPDPLVVFADDFEGTAVGEYPEAKGWKNLFSGVDAHVSDEQAHSGNRSLRLESAPTWSRTDYVEVSDLPDRFSYEVSVLVDPTPGRSAFVGFPEAVANQGPFYNHFALATGDGSTGQVRFSGASGEEAAPLGEFAVKEWCTVRADLDFRSLTATLWLNGEQRASDVPIQPKEFDQKDWGHMVLSKWGATEYNWRGEGTGVIYVDDVKLLSTGAE